MAEWVGGGKQGHSLLCPVAGGPDTLGSDFPALRLTVKLKQLLRVSFLVLPKWAAEGNQTPQVLQRSTPVLHIALAQHFEALKLAGEVAK